MPLAQRLYRTGILLARYATVDTAHADRYLNPWWKSTIPRSYPLLESFYKSMWVWPFVLRDGYRGNCLWEPSYCSSVKISKQMHSFLNIVSFKYHSFHSAGSLVLFLCEYWVINYENFSFMSISYSFCEHVLLCRRLIWRTTNGAIILFVGTIELGIYEAAVHFYSYYVNSKLLRAFDLLTTVYCVHITNVPLLQIQRILWIW